MNSTLCLLGCFFCILFLNCGNVKCINPNKPDTWKEFSWMGKEFAALTELPEFAKQGIGSYWLYTNVRVSDELTTKIPIKFEYELKEDGKTASFTSCEYPEGANGPVKIGVNDIDHSPNTIIRPAGSMQRYKLHCGMFSGATITKWPPADAKNPTLPGMGEERAALELCAVAKGQTTPKTLFVWFKQYKAPINFSLECTPKSAVVVGCSFGEIGGPGEIIVKAGAEGKKKFEYLPEGNYRSVYFSFGCDPKKGVP